MMYGRSMYALRLSAVQIGRVNQRLSVMDLSFPSHRQQLYHRTGNLPYFPPERKKIEADREGRERRDCGKPGNR